MIIRDINKLEPKFRCAILKLFELMKHEGWHPVPIETLRTLKRQKQLYSIGRTGLWKSRKPVTWTLKSMHLPDRNGYAHAIDVIDKRYGYNNKEFYKCMKRICKQLGLFNITKESCHVQDKAT